jgi:hypothetical protein
VAAILRTPPKNQTGGKEEAKEEGRGEAECVEGVEGGGGHALGEGVGCVGGHAVEADDAAFENKKKKKKKK